MIGKGKSISHGTAALEYDLAKEIDGQTAAIEIARHELYGCTGRIQSIVRIGLINQCRIFLRIHDIDGFCYVLYTKTRFKSYYITSLLTTLRRNKYNTISGTCSINGCCGSIF